MWRRRQQIRWQTRKIAIDHVQPVLWAKDQIVRAVFAAVVERAEKFRRFKQIPFRAQPVDSQSLRTFAIDVKTWSTNWASSTMRRI